jgi:predicted nucleic acid-binding protein
VRGVDSSILVAALVEAHPRFEACHALLAESGPHELLAAGPSLVEAYGALTTLVPPYRPSPRAALELMKTLLPKLRIAHSPASPWEMLQDVALRGLTGPAARQALLLRTLVSGGAHILYTLQARTLRALAPPEIELREP